MTELTLNEQNTGGQRTIWLTIVGAVALSAAFFLRFLEFFRTPTLGRIVVLLALAVFFFWCILFFVLPIFQALWSNRRFFWLLLSFSVLMVAALYFLLPYDNVPFRTTHILTVTVPGEADQVVLEGFWGPDGNPIPLTDLDTTARIEGEDVFLASGDSLNYTREMTGGVSFSLSAIGAPAQVVVTWDGRSETIELDVTSRDQVRTDPTSWGYPGRWMNLFMTYAVLNELLVMVAILMVVWGFFYQLIQPDLKSPPGWPHGCPYLRDYLILTSILILIALGERYLRTTPQTYAPVLLAPTLVYLLLKWLLPRVKLLPLIVVMLGVAINLMAAVPAFNQNYLRVQRMEEPSFNALAIQVNPYETTLLSVGFYKQLQGAQILVSPDSDFTSDIDLQRLITINQLESARVADYAGELTSQQAQALLDDYPSLEWQKRTPGAFYLIEADERSQEPILFFWQGNDVFLVPAPIAKDMGLIDDLVFD